MIKRIIIISVILALALMGGKYAFFSTHPKSLASEALESILDENFYSADLALNALEKQNHPLVSLYRGYLRQAMGKFCEADFYFGAALSTRDTRALHETLLAQALNALLKEHYAEVPCLIERARKLNPESPYNAALFAIACYFKGNMDDAITYFRLAQKKTEPSSWFSTLFEKHFSPLWMDVHLAHALMVERKFTEANEILAEKEEGLAKLFLGLCALLESREAPESEKESLYRLAAFHFEHADLKECFERKVVSRELGQQIATLIREKSEWVPPFIHQLEKWEQRALLQELADQFAPFADTHIAHLQQSCPLFFTFLHDKALQNTLECLQKGDLDAAEHSWIKIEHLAANSPELTQKVISCTHRELLHHIPADDQKLRMVTAYLTFWKRLEKNPKQHLILAKELIHQGKMLWLKEGEENKATHTLSMALALAQKNEKKQIAHELELFFEKLATLAEDSNMVRRLFLVYDALDQLSLKSRGVFSETKVANYLADADYLFGAHNFSSAKTHAELVLKLDPINEGAQKLLGLSLYHMGEYKLAAEALKKVTVIDDNVSKALALSQIHFRAEEEKHLVQLDTLDNLSEND